MKNFVLGIMSLAIAAGLGFGAANAQTAPAKEGAAAEHSGTPHYPIKHPHAVAWPFAGIFGKYDKAQLQRGLKVYKEVCSACHSMRLVAFRNLEDLGYSEAQVKAFAGEYEVQDGPNAEGEMYTRKAVPSDYFPSPFANTEAAQAANGGAAPPDMSLLAKARGVERGFPQFIFDIFWPYQEGGPDYIHSLLTGYEEPPAGVEVAEGTHYNPYFISGPALKMAPPLADGQVTYDDDAPQTLDQYAHDVSAFLMWASEPHLEERKRMGFRVLLFLLGLTALVYLTKKAVYSTKEH